MVLCWRSAGAGSSDAGYNPTLSPALLALSLPAASRVRVLGLTRLWAVLDVVSIFSHDTYTYSLLAPKYIYPLVAARPWEHDQRLKAGTLSLGGQSSLHYSNVDCHASGDQRGQRLERGQPFQYIACKASRWYLGRRRSICLRLEEPHHLIYHPGKTFSDNVTGKHSGSNMSCAIVGQHHHHFLPIAPLASLAHPPASRYCRSHWWYPTWPFGDGPHSWIF